MNKAPGRVHWFHMGSWGVFLGFTSSREAFDRMMKRLRIAEPRPVFLGEGAGGTCHTFDKPNDGGACILITLDLSSDHSPAAIAGLVAHEAMHAVQYIWAFLGERQPGKEAEAYLMQYIVVRILMAVEADKKRESATPQRPADPEKVA